MIKSELRALIEKEFEDFFEFPFPDNRPDAVTIPSAKLFAEHIAGKAGALSHIADAGKKVDGLVEALEIIAGMRQCVDVIMGDPDIAIEALAAYRKGLPHED